MGAVPLHAPGSAVSSSPSVALPDTVGGLVFAGALAATSAVGADRSLADPPPLVAVTSTRIVCPASGEATVYVRLVAPSISAQPLPSASQRSHWEANVIGGVP